MALIREFVPLELERKQLHEEVEARWTSYEIDGVSFVQINTYGRPTRELRGKLSQTIQLDRAAAEQLVGILRHSFKLT
jgi:hypothetical protein